VELAADVIHVPEVPICGARPIFFHVKR